MKVVYTKEQKQTAIKTYKKLKSYEKTLRVLGYPSRHVLYDWVNKRDHKNPNSNPHRTPKRYTWQQKYEVITLVKAGHNIHEVAENKNITSANHIYKWLRLYRLYGVRGIMTKKEKIEVGFYKTKAQLKKELSDDVDELKEIAAKLIAEKAVLKEELELSKKLKGRHP